MSEVTVDIKEGHLFRYPSEIDPRKKLSKVSFKFNIISKPKHLKLLS